MTCACGYCEVEPGQTFETAPFGPNDYVEVHAAGGCLRGNEEPWDAGDEVFLPGASEWFTLEPRPEEDAR